MGDTRRRGLMVGIELVRPRAQQVALSALNKGLVVNAIGEKTIRMLPPLIVTRAHIGEAVSILGEVLTEEAIVG